MASPPVAVRLVFPHQLFSANLETDKHVTMVLVEDDLFFKQYAFHKQKLLLHRASLRQFADELQAAGFTVVMLETEARSTDEQLRETLERLKVTDISYYDLIDDWLQRKIDAIVKQLKLKVARLNSPSFLTTPGQIDDYFDNNPNRMQYFYEWQRKRLNILMDGTKPVGGAWSFDTANRKKLPKSVTLPPTYKAFTSKHSSEAQEWVENAFKENPGDSSSFAYPVTHEQAEQQLQSFIYERLGQFGPYEDAIVEAESQLFHSVLSPLLNIGLLTPQQVIDAVLSYATNHEVPIASLEGFIRQIIGWREYMRASYVRYGRTMRTSNHLKFTAKLSDNWWDGSTGLAPIDTTIQRVLKTGYAHHIERLMVLGNAMVLLRIDPDEVYRWFMSLFIDAYDWVMVPNVYAMSQFAAGEMIITKPYISGSNYLIKMSDYTKGDWAEVWDALYWQFIADYRPLIEQNYRTRMVVSLYDRFDDAKKKRLADTAREWLA